MCDLRVACVCLLVSFLTILSPSTSPLAINLKLLSNGLKHLQLKPAKIKCCISELKKTYNSTQTVNSALKSSREQTAHSSIHPVIHSFIPPLCRDNRLLFCVVFMVSVCGFFSQAQCAVDSGSLFTLIKFNRPASVPQDPEHMGRQQSNADFHYVKLQ